MQKLKYKIIYMFLGRRKFCFLSCRSYYPNGIQDEIRNMHFNSVELDLIQIHYYKELLNAYKQADNRNPHRVMTLKKTYIDTITYKIIDIARCKKALLRIKRFGIYFNYEPTPLQILKAIILKYYFKIFHKTFLNS